MTIILFLLYPVLDGRSTQCLKNKLTSEDHQDVSNSVIWKLQLSHESNIVSSRTNAHTIFSFTVLKDPNNLEAQIKHCKETTQVIEISV